MKPEKGEGRKEKGDLPMLPPPGETLLAIRVGHHFAEGGARNFWPGFVRNSAAQIAAKRTAA